MEPEEKELIESGRRRRAMPLVEQVRVTLKLAEGEGPGFHALLSSPTLLADAETQADGVEASMGSREIAEADAEGATHQQNEQMARAKVWLRKMAARSKRATRSGAVLPKELLETGRARAIPKMMAVLQKATKLMEIHKDQLAKAGSAIEPLIEEGKDIRAKLVNFDAIQEAAYISSVPDAIRDFWKAKGKLYLSLKSINDTAHEYYAGDLTKAAQYNMNILYR